MPVHVENMTNEVSAFDGELPLSEAQIDKLFKLLVQRLERRERDEQAHREATALRPRATPAAPVKD